MKFRLISYISRKKWLKRIGRIFVSYCDISDIAVTPEGQWYANDGTNTNTTPVTNTGWIW